MLLLYMYNTHIMLLLKLSADEAELPALDTEVYFASFLF